VCIQVLTQLATGHRTLHIETDALEFPTSELKEQVNALGHLNIVVSRMSNTKITRLANRLTARD
jgi:hypothetical protein